MLASVLDLTDQRLAIMAEVAAIKWRQQVAITDTAREQQIIDEASSAAGKLGLESNAVRALLSLQIRMARDVQNQLHVRWRNNGFDGQTAPRDLQRQIRPQLDVLSANFLIALAVAAPTLEGGNLAARFPGLDVQHLRNPAWSDESRNALLAALGAVRRDSAAPLQRIRSAGVLRVGTTGDYPPWSFERDGTLSGADIELAKALAAHLAVRTAFVRTTWPTLLDDLRADRFDIALGGISLNAERARVAAFSVPYATGGKTIIARCVNARRFRSLAAVDRADVRLLVNPGGTNQQFVTEHIHRASVRILPDNLGVFDDLVAGRGDAMITDDIEVELQIRRHRELCRAMPGLLTHGTKAVLMAQDAALVNAIDAALQVEIAAGNPARLRHEFLASESVRTR